MLCVLPGIWQTLYRSFYSLLRQYRGTNIICQRSCLWRLVQRLAVLWVDELKYKYSFLIKGCKEKLQAQYFEICEFPLFFIRFTLEQSVFNTISKHNSFPFGKDSYNTYISVYCYNQGNKIYKLRGSSAKGWCMSNTLV